MAIKRRASILDLFGVGPYFRTQIAFSLPYGNVGTKEVKVYLKMINAGHGLGNMEVEDMKLSITTTTRERDETIYLAEVVEKILRKDANKQRFYLTESSKAALSVIPSYNWTLSPSYMWLHLTRVADYIKAFPTAHYGEVKYKNVAIYWYLFNSATLWQQRHLQRTLPLARKHKLWTLSKIIIPAIISGLKF